MTAVMRVRGPLPVLVVGLAATPPGASLLAIRRRPPQSARILFAPRTRAPIRELPVGASAAAGLGTLRQWQARRLRAEEALPLQGLGGLATAGAAVHRDCTPG